MSVQIAVRLSIVSDCGEPLVLYQSPAQLVTEQPSTPEEPLARGVDRILSPSTSTIAPGLSVAVAI
ncbi:MAG TPA: hypothetical protein VFW04_12255 [Gemmatimonadaceae bacterium]|nr:hypothetical protein [Gemmatimonadaceae bacterium]